MFIKPTKELLVIRQCANGDLIGEVYFDGVEKRGKWDMRARFCDSEATSFRVREYFGFSFARTYCPKQPTKAHRLH